MAAEADAAATVSSTISLIPCPSKSGCSSARASSARSNENVTPPASAPASTVSRSERCHPTRTSCAVVASRPTERISSSGASEASASSISSRPTVTVAASGRSPTSSGVATSIAVAVDPYGSMKPPFPWCAARGRAALSSKTAKRSRDLPPFVTIVAWLGPRAARSRPAAGPVLFCGAPEPHRTDGGAGRERPASRRREVLVTNLRRPPAQARRGRPRAALARARDALVP